VTSKNEEVNKHSLEILQQIKAMSSNVSDWLSTSATAQRDKIATSNSNCLSQWLLSSCKSDAKWLNRNSQSEKELDDTLEKEMMNKQLFPDFFFNKENESMWVKTDVKEESMIPHPAEEKRDESTVKSPISAELFTSFGDNCKENWLVKNLCGSSNMNSVSDVKNIMRQFLQPANLNVWLQQQNGDAVNDHSSLSLKMLTEELKWLKTVKY
jgi:hypothetical protein